MRRTVTRGNIRVAGAISGNSIGLLDEPILPQRGGTNHVVFYPFRSGIGTTTIVQRLCGSDPTSPTESYGINGYRAVWSIELDSVGTVRYENFFLWDVSRAAADEMGQFMDIRLESARVIVLLIPSDTREILNEVAQWYQGHIQEPQRVVIVITKSDLIERAKIRPSDIENLSSTLNCPVVQVSGANMPQTTKNGLHPTIRNLVLAIADNLPQT